MNGADVFVQHSITDSHTGDQEGLPVAVLEAMASGLPVVATRHAGIPEAVVEGETGYLVEEGDIGAMAGHIARLAEDHTLRSKMARRDGPERETISAGNVSGLNWHASWALQGICKRRSFTMTFDEMFLRTPSGDAAR